MKGNGYVDMCFTAVNDFRKDETVKKKLWRTKIEIFLDAVVFGILWKCSISLNKPLEECAARRNCSFRVSEVTTVQRILLINY